MSGYGSHSSEAEVRAEYDAAKRKVFEESHGPLAQVAVAALWIIRQRSIRHLRAMDARLDLRLRLIGKADRGRHAASPAPTLLDAAGRRDTGSARPGRGTP